MADPILRSPEELQKCLLENDRRPDPDHTLAAIEHRQRLVRIWEIPRGATILEVGCGQGDCTVVLADAVGPEGRVVGVDPLPLDEGVPAVGRAREHVKSSPVGKQIEFIQTDAASYLVAPTDLHQFDYVVFTHSVWYLPQPGMLAEIFDLVRRHARAPTVLLAEFASVASVPEAVPHVLAQVAVNALESVLDPSLQGSRNMCCTISPRQMTDAARKGGWVMQKEQRIVPKKGQRDGWREVVMVLEPPYHRKRFEDHVKSIKDEKIKSMLFSARDAVEEAAESLDGGLAAVRNMDVWVARFEVAKADS